MIAFSVREKRRMGRFWVVMKNISGDGEVKHVLNVKFWGRIREGGIIYRDVRLEGNV